MNRFLTIMILIFLQLPTVMAQHEGKKKDKIEKIHAAKLAYITDRLHLSESQVVNFIPVYNDYENAIKDTRHYFMEKTKVPNPESADDSTVKVMIDDNLDYQERVIGIKRRYNEQFLKVMATQQLKELPAAEREFKKMLIHEMEMRRMGSDDHHGPGPGWGRPGRRF